MRSGTSFLSKELLSHRPYRRGSKSNLSRLSALGIKRMIRHKLSGVGGEQKQVSSSLTIAHAPTSARALNRTLTLYRNTLLYIVLLAPVINFVASLASGRMEGALVAASSNTANQIIIIFVFFNCIVVARIFKLSILDIGFALVPAILMVGWMLLSVTWSDYPDLTLRRASRETIELLSLILLGLSFRDERSIIRILYWSFLITLVCDLVSLAVPSLSFSSGLFSGIHENKNEAGAFLFYALPILAIGVLDKAISVSRISALFAFTFGVAILVLSLSKSAIGIIFIAGLLSLLTRFVVLPNMYSRIVIPIAGLIATIAIGMIAFGVGIAEILNTLFGDATLTGRDELWRYALSKYDAQPMQGVGYGALWQVGPQFNDILQKAQVHWLANQAHDGYIDVLAQLGVVGAGFLGVYLAFTLLRILRYASNASRANLVGLADYSIYLFWGIVIYNITESSFFRIGHPVWMTFVLIATCATGLTFRRQRLLRSPVLLRQAI